MTAIHQREGNPEGGAVVFVYRSVLLLRQQKFESAERLVKEAYSILEPANNPNIISYASRAWGYALLGQAKVSESIPKFQHSLS